MWPMCESIFSKLNRPALKVPDPAHSLKQDKEQLHQVNY